MNTTIESTAPKSAAARLRELNSVEKPAKSGLIKLRQTLVEKKTIMTHNASQITFEIPAWVAARFGTLHGPNIVWGWFQNAQWLNDPDHGEFTQARFIDAWAKVMESKDRWMNRDKVITLEYSITFKDWEADALWITAEFLGVSREVLLVGIMASEALARAPEAAPKWDDMAMIRAAQSA